MKTRKLSVFSSAAIVALVLFTTVLSARAQFNGGVSVQAVTNPSYSGPDISRTKGIAFWVEPLKDGDVTGQTLTSLDLTGASAAQFRCRGLWPSGNCKYVQVDAELASYVANTPSSLTFKLTGGTGSFGGSNLATDNGATITVNTGPAQFTIRKAGFDVFNKVVVGGRTIVDNTVTQNSDGLVLKGPSNVFGANAIPTATPSLSTTSCPTGAGCVQAFSCSGQVGCPSTSRTYQVAASYTSANGEGPVPRTAFSSTGSPGTIVTVSVTVPAGSVLEIVSPAQAATGPVATGWIPYVASGGTVNTQSPIFPIPLGTNWTEPLACQVTLADNTAITVPSSNCFTGTHVLSLTPIAQSWQAAGNDGCWIGTCNTQYKSINDTASTVTIVENGPVKALLKAVGSHASTSTACPAGAANSTGGETPNCYMHYTMYMYFYKDQSWVKTIVQLRNADLTPCSGSVCTPSSPASTTYATSDFKAFQSFNIDIAMAGANVSTQAKKVFTQADASVNNAACPSALCTATLDGTHDAFMYQAYNCLFEHGELNGQAYHPSGSAASYYPPFFTYNVNGSCPTNLTKQGQGGGYGYVQEGYEVTINNAVQASGTRSVVSVGQGWLDLVDPGDNNAGILIATPYIAAQYPKELKAHARGVNQAYDAVVGVLPDQTDPLNTSTIQCGTTVACASAIPYYQPWPMHTQDEFMFDFHSASVNGATEFANYQQFLVGLPVLADYNRSNVLTEIFPFVDGNTFDTWMINTAKVAGWSAPPDFPQFYRYVAWPGSGEGNQNERGFQEFYKYATRTTQVPGHSTDLLFAKSWYKMFEVYAAPSADFNGGWRGQCVGSNHCQNLDDLGEPVDPLGQRSGGGMYPVGNRNYSFRDWDSDAEHDHWFEVGDYALLFGNQADIDFATTSWNDMATNPNIIFVVGCSTGGGAAFTGGTCYRIGRSIGQALSHCAQAYTFLNSQFGLYTTDANNALSKCNSIVTNELPMTAYGWGTGTTREGINAVTGGTWGGSFDSGSNSNDDDSLCPIDVNGSCGALSPFSSQFTGSGYSGGMRIATSFFYDMEIQGLLNALEAFGPTWTFWTQATDTLQGLGRFFLQEGGWVELGTTTAVVWNSTHCPGYCLGGTTPNWTSCTSSATCGTGGTCTGIGTGNIACYPGRPYSGTAEWDNLEFYNADKVQYLGHNNGNSEYFNFMVLPLLGERVFCATTDTTCSPYYDAKLNNLSVLNSYEEHLQVRGVGGAEDGSPEEVAAASVFFTTPVAQFSWSKLSSTFTTPTLQWVKVPITVNGVANGSCTSNPCTITWTPPTSVVGYRLKTNSLAVQDYVRLDNLTDPHNTLHGCSSPINGGASEIPPESVTPAVCNGSAFGGATYPNSQCHYGCWIDNPTVVAPFFSSTEVPVTGTPAGTFTYTWTSGTNRFELRALVGTVSVPPPPPTVTSTGVVR